MFNIRPFEKKDQKQVNGLFFQLTQKPIVMEADSLLNDTACKCMVIEDGNIVVGFAALISYHLPTIGKIGRIEDVIIMDEYRARGLGRKLMMKIMEIAKDNNLRELHLTSNPKRTAARSLYTSLGFKMRDTNVFTLSI